MQGRLQGARRRELGFTMSEVLVALLLAGIVVTAVYDLFITTSYVFHSQEQVSDRLSNLRFALDRVKDDLRQAAFMATPNSASDSLVCPKPARPFHGAILRDGAGRDLIPHPESNPFVEPDELVLLGNYTTALAYPATVQARRVTLLPDPSFREGGLGTPEGFEAAFLKGGLLRITNAGGRSEFLTVEGSQPDARVVLLRDSPTVSTDGLCGLVGAAPIVEVNPVNLVRYRLAEAAPEEPDNPLRVLVRDQLDAELRPIEGTEVVVAENVVDFQVWFLVKDEVASRPGHPVIPDDPDPFDDAGNLPEVLLDGSERARPELIRSAVVRISAITDREDPRLRHRPREARNAPLLTFDLDGRDDAAAPVSTMTAEVELLNFSFREGST